MHDALFRWTGRSLSAGVAVFCFLLLDLLANVATGPAFAAGRAFQRGHVIGNGGIQIGDAVRILSDLFLGLSFIHCADAADVNDDGRIDITDPVYLLGYLFLGGPPPPEPFADCGLDPTEDVLACAEVFDCAPCGDRCGGASPCVPIGPAEFACTQELTTCEEVTSAYTALTTGLKQPCSVVGQCEVLFGHCGVALGGCYHAVSSSPEAAVLVTQETLNALAARFVELGCSGPVCDCRPPPSIDCVEGECVLRF